MRCIVLFFLFAGTFNITAIETNPEKIKILSTIKPIHLIVVALTDRKADPDQLIPDFSSPHHYSFRPSDIRKIKKASLIFRIDEHFESAINPALSSYSKPNRLISLAEEGDLQLLPMKEGHSHGHEGEDFDMHIWTSPQNIIVMANTIASYLIKYDKLNAQTYTKNLEDFTSNVLSHSHKINLELQPFRNKPYAIFNNTWNYFAHTYKLREPILINTQEGQSANIKSILSIRKRIKTKEVGCVFSDPSMNKARLNVITEELTVNSAQIDILASNIIVKKDAYFSWITSMSKKIKQCLSYSNNP